MPLLATFTTAPLVANAHQGIKEVIDFMDVYSMSRDGRDSVLEFSEWKYDKNNIIDLTKAIQPLVKSAFTRAYNAGARTVVSKRSKKQSDDVDDFTDDLTREDEEGEDEDRENDSLISMAKPKNQKAAAPKTAKASGKKTSGAKKT
jgi:hypothetical protein